MSLSALFAVVLAFGFQTQEESVDAILAPVLDAQGVAAACFAPARWQPGERSRECQHRLLREEAARGGRLASLQSQCERTSLPGETVEVCMRRIVTDQVAAREARAEERRARLARSADEDPFDWAAAPPPAAVTRPAPAPAPAPAPPARRGCRRETTRNADGSGGSIAWVCGDGAARDALDALRESSRPQALPPGW